MGERKGRRDAQVTISDVAQKAGVSRTAVSFVLNEHGERNRYVSEETHAKVWQAVQELHYQPDLLARTLRTGQSTEIAGIIDTTVTLLGLEVSIATRTSLQRCAEVLIPEVPDLIVGPLGASTAQSFRTLL